MKKLLAIIISVCVMLPVAAKKHSDDDESQRFPSRCYPQGFDYHHKVLHFHPHSDDNVQSMYFIHNISNSSVTLRQMRTGDEPFALNLNNTIRPNNWGVFAGRDKVIKYFCTKEKPGREYGEIIDCSKVLDICEYPNIEFAIINRGSYWVESSASMRSAQRSAIRKGALLHGRGS